MAEFERPKIPYNNQSLPYDNRYTKAQSKGKPVQGQDLDGDINFIIDSLNELFDEIQAIVAGNIPGSSDLINANKLLTTGGAGNLSWINIGTDNIEDGAITENKIGNQEVTTDKLGDGAVTSVKITDGEITENKYANDSIVGNKIKAATIYLTKLVHDATGGFVFSRTGSTAIELLPVLDTDRWKLPVRIDPPAATISMQYLDVIWGNNPSSFTGTKLTNASTPLNKLSATANASIVISGANENTYKELIVSDLDRWKVFTRGAHPEAQVNKYTLDEVWNNTAVNFDGSKIADNSVTIAKIAGISNIREIKPFVTATVSAAGALLRGTNVTNITKLDTGEYRVNFASQPTTGSTNYNVQVSVDGAFFRIGWDSKTLNSVKVFTTGTNLPADRAFDIVIWDTTA